MSASRAFAVARELTASLDALAHALRLPDAAGLIAAEQRLSAALAAPMTSAADDRTRHELTREIGRARAALARCRILGSSLSAAVHTSLTAQGGEYGPRAVAAPRPLPVPSVKVSF